MNGNMSEPVQQRREWPTRRISFFVLPGVHLMNLGGPLDVFARASSRLLADGRRATPAYEIELLTGDDNALTTATGLALMGGRPWDQATQPIDTLIVVSGAEVFHQLPEPRILEWFRQSAKNLRRIASVCAGAFVLAEAGILDGRRATTHWNAAARLARLYPKISVDADRIFVQDGNVWTSAGVSAGADLALAMLEDDFGHVLAVEIAQHMVLSLRRNGSQSQFSPQLAAQAADHQPIRELIAWIYEHLDADLSVPVLARRAGMSERNFSRIFVRQVGTTPARFVANLRLDAARARLEETSDKVDAIAQRTGLGDGETLRRHVRARLATSPGVYRARRTRAQSGFLVS
jgi:transcriptional regulator GlxA family with amidase domain